jgi:hypothetical protein
MESHKRCWGLTTSKRRDKPRRGTQESALQDYLWKPESFQFGPLELARSAWLSCAVSER